MYNRKIIYFHRYEGEVDKGNVGYLKQEIYNGICTFTVMLMNMPPEYEADTFLVVFPVGHTLCKVHIGDGKGQGLAICEERQLEKAGVILREISKYEIFVSKEIVIRGEMIQPKKAREEVRPIERNEIFSENETEDDAENAHQKNDRVDEEKTKIVSSVTPYERTKEIYKSKWEQLCDGKKKVNLMGKESE